MGHLRQWFGNTLYRIFNMPTESSQQVTIIQNADGSFTATTTAQSVQTVQISLQAMIDFIQSQDQSNPPTPPS